MLVYAIVFLVPLISVSNIVLSEFTDPDDKSLDNLYENGLITREDPNTDVYFKDKYIPQIIASAFAILFIVQFYRAYQSFKLSDKRREELKEYDDEFYGKLDEERGADNSQ